MIACFCSQIARLSYESSGVSISQSNEHQHSNVDMGDKLCIRRIRNTRWYWTDGDSWSNIIFSWFWQLLYESYLLCLQMCARRWEKPFPWEARSNALRVWKVIWQRWWAKKRSPISSPSVSFSWALGATICSSTRTVYLAYLTWTSRILCPNLYPPTSIIWGSLSLSRSLSPHLHESFEGLSLTSLKSKLPHATHTSLTRKIFSQNSLLWEKKNKLCMLVS